MFMNPTNYYHNALMASFIQSLISDKNSVYYKKTEIEVVEDILNKHVYFSIDDEDTIYESIGSVKTEIFTKDWKNEEAIYVLKILLSEYPENIVDEDTQDES